VKNDVFRARKRAAFHALQNQSLNFGSADFNGHCVSLILFPYYRVQRKIGSFEAIPYPKLDHVKAGRQAYEELDIKKISFIGITSAGGAKTKTELRWLLGCFLFSEYDVFKRIGVLSGGERNRYALVKLLLRPSNFIRLDAPANHLDRRTKEVLLESLASFTGTVTFVSHDRCFIDKLATKVLKIGNGAIESYPGNYEQYLRKKRGHDEVLTAKMTEQLAAADPMAVALVGQKKLVDPMKLKQMEDRFKQLLPRFRRVRQLPTVDRCP